MTRRRECSSHSSSDFFRSAFLLLALFALSEGVCPLQVSAYEARFERVGPYGGTVHSLLVSSKDSSLVYLGTNDGQLFKSTDGGSSWRLLYPGLKRRQFVIDSMAEDPVNADHLYVGGWDLRSDGGGLFESEDAGRSWNQVFLPEANVAVRAFAISKGHPRYMIAGTGVGVFVSSDGGKTWQQRGTSAGLYESRDSGHTWERVPDGRLGVGVSSLIFLDASGKRILVADNTFGGVLLSEDAGAHWEKIENPEFGSPIRSLAQDPLHLSVIYLGTGTEGVYRLSLQEFADGIR